VNNLPFKVVGVLRTKGTSSTVIFGYYPARRASALDPTMRFVRSKHDGSYRLPCFAGANGRPYRRYNVGTTIMLSNVDDMRPHRMTIAMGV
jgi:hypothetical protein